MKYLKIIVNPTDIELRSIIIDALRVTTDHPPIVTEDGELFLQLHTDEELIGEVFNLGITFGELLQAHISDPFDFEVVTRKVLPPQVAMAMN